MAWKFKPWEKPTGGVPPPIVLGYEDQPDGSRVAFNRSAWWLPVQRADGSRDVLHRCTAIELRPGDRVLQPMCAYDPIESSVLLAAKLEGFRAYQEPWSRSPSDGAGRWWWHRRGVRPGVALHLQPGSFGNARLTLSVALDAAGSEQQWCFHDSDAAWRAVLAWNGEGDPEGFYRCYQTGRRRDDGTPESEHILW